MFPPAIAASFLSWLPRAARKGPRTAIVWLTHFHDPQAVGAFRRLRRDARPSGRVFCACHGDAPLRRLGVPPVRVDEPAFHAALPSRARQCAERGTKLYGFIDLAHFAIARQIPDFDHYWFVEYDVDFSGRWTTLFEAFADCQADLLGTTIYPRDMDPEWYFWPEFTPGRGALSRHHMRGFFPIVRLSRRFMDTYAAEVGNGWAGHFEALYPTLAAVHGLAVEDIGGDGPLVPAARRGRYYSNSSSDEFLSPGSFRFRPPIASRYYSPGAAEFPKPDFLWHPIKTAATHGPDPEVSNWRRDDDRDFGGAGA
jgi:hypothetical protein